MASGGGNRSRDNKQLCIIYKVYKIAQNEIYTIILEYKSAGWAGVSTAAWQQGGPGFDP